MKSASKKIKIGVFGAARGMTMINILAHHPHAELVAVCDRYEPLLQKCQQVADAAARKISLYTDFEAFFNHEMDAVVLANYAHEHAPFAIRLLDSGRHVISEVLPVETLAQAVALVEAVERSGQVYAYAENYCYFAATQEMKRRYQLGDIGEFMHGEGEYVHNCEPIWHEITYGQKDHWRNNKYATFYCTHSLGPILTITGTRPLKVVGFETPNAPYMAAVGYRGGTSGMEILQMSNGATVKSLHGNLKREPSSIWYAIYGSRGMMESDRWHEGVGRVNLFQDQQPLSHTEISYRPRPWLDSDLSRSVAGHGGSDFYTLHFFLEKIRGEAAGEHSIDVYQALDMGLPGILAHRSICSGNIPIAVPDLRNPAERDAYRHDNWCVNPAIAGGQLAPQCSFGSPPIPDSVYEQVRQKWLNTQK